METSSLKKMLIIAVASTFCISSMIIAATSGKTASDIAADNNWYTMGQCRGVQGAGVSGLVFGPEGDLHVWGSFTSAGGVRANNIARWDGIEWHPIRTDLEFSGTVVTAAVHNSTMYLGGNIRWSRTRYKKLLAWDGVDYRPIEVPTEMNNLTTMACDHNGTLYVASSDVFLNKRFSLIFRLDDTSWTVLNDTIKGVIHTIAFNPNGDLYAGGVFDSISSIPARSIARWNGIEWNSIGEGIDSAVYTIVFDEHGNLFAGGTFKMAGETPARNVAKWNGSTWSALGDGCWTFEADCFGDLRCTYSPEAIYSLAIGPDRRLYAGGSFTIPAPGLGVWDGNSWKPLPGGHSLAGIVYTLAFDKEGTLFCGGTFQFSLRAGENPVPLNLVAQWRDSIFQPLGSRTGTGLDGPVKGFSADKTGKVYVNGRFSSAGITQVVPNLGIWDDSRWRLPGCQYFPPFNTPVIFLGDGSYLYVQNPNLNARELDGSIWECTAGTLTKRVKDIRGTISILAVSESGDVYAGGRFRTFAEGSFFHVAMVNKDSFSALGKGTNGPISTLAIDSKGHLYAGGEFDSAGSSAARNVALWNGSEWEPLSTGINGPVSTLIIDVGDILYAGGTFDTAGGVPASCIARWENGRWHPLGRGITGSYKTVCAIAVDENGNVFAGGNFKSTGAVSANNLAKWDGSEWHALGSGTDGQVDALLVDRNGDLFVGGMFLSAGGKVSPHFAIYRGTGTGLMARPLMPSDQKRVGFSFEHEKKIVHLSLRTATMAHFSLFSLNGKEIARYTRQLPSGVHEHRISTTGVTPGIYIFQVKAGGAMARFRTLFYP